MTRSDDVSKCIYSAMTTKEKTKICSFSVSCCFLGCPIRIDNDNSCPGLLGQCYWRLITLQGVISQKVGLLINISGLIDIMKEVAFTLSLPLSLSLSLWS
jgi:hypothetical protein